MLKAYRVFVVISLTAILLAACTGKDSENPTPEQEPTSQDSPMTVPEDTVTRSEEATTTPDTQNPETSGVDYPEWQLLEVKDVNTGETFTLADFAGKVVFVESMATWCTNCRQQLQNVRVARTQTDNDRFAFVALSLETNLDDADLASYAEREGFDWIFAVMSNDMLRALADEFGRSISTAPSTPHFIIRPDGTYTGLVTGIDSPEEILQQMTEAAGA